MIQSVAMAFHVRAADYPTRPIRFIVPSAAGGAPDATARILCLELARQMGALFVVDNRPGASGRIGTELIVRAPSDGYTVGTGNFPTLVTNRIMFSKLPYELDRDIELISQFNATYNIVAITQSLPVKSVSELIEFGRNHAGKLLFASVGNGSSQHLSGELLKRTTGMQMTHVPFKGASQAIGDMIAGQIQVFIDNAASVGPHVRAARVRGLAVTAARRSDAYPELPTVAESGVPKFEVAPIGGLIAPAGISRTIVNRLNREINQALGSATVKEKFAVLGNNPIGGTPEEFVALVKREVAKWSEVIKGANIRAD